MFITDYETVDEFYHDLSDRLATKSPERYPRSRSFEKRLRVEQDNFVVIAKYISNRLSSLRTSNGTLDIAQNSVANLGFHEQRSTDIGSSSKYVGHLIMSGGLLIRKEGLVIDATLSIPRPELNDLNLGLELLLEQRVAV